MLRTLSERQKTDWKAYVQTLTHAYNAATHANTRYAPFYLMFGRHPRLPVDAFLALWVEQAGNDTRADYVNKLRNRLVFAYVTATKEAVKSGERQKMVYDQKVRSTVTEPGDRELVRNVGFKGPQKLANKWEDQPYIVKKSRSSRYQTFQFTWSREKGGSGKLRTLHRNMLLPFNNLPIHEDELPPKRVTKTLPKTQTEGDPESSADDSSSDDESDEECCRQEIPLPYVSRKGLAKQA